MEFAFFRQSEIRKEVLPSLLDLRHPVQDVSHGLKTFEDAPDVDAPVPEPLEHDRQPRGPFDGQIPAPFRRLPLLLDHLEQRGCDHRAWHFAAVHHARSLRGENVDRAQDGNPDPQMLTDLNQLLELARVIAELGDGEPGPCRCLLAELVVLRKALPFHLFEWGYGAPREKPLRVAFIPYALAQHGEHAKEGDRVEIKYRRALPTKTGARVVARERQDVLHPHPCQLERAALHAGPVHVPAGEVDDNVHPRLKDFLADPIRAQGRISARVVRDGDRRDPAVSKGVRRDPLHRIKGSAPGLRARDQFQGDHKPLRVLDMFAK